MSGGRRRECGDDLREGSHERRSGEPSCSSRPVLPYPTAWLSPAVPGGGERSVADHGLDVEISKAPGGPGDLRKVFAGNADFYLTSVHHYLTAMAESGPLPVRFVAVVLQTSPVAAVVRVASDFLSPADPVRPAARCPARQPAHGRLFAAMGPQSAELCPMDCRRALAWGEIDTIIGLWTACPEPAGSWARHSAPFPAPAGTTTKVSARSSVDRVRSRTPRCHRPAAPANCQSPGRGMSRGTSTRGSTSDQQR